MAETSNATRPKKKSILARIFYVERHSTHHINHYAKVITRKTSEKSEFRKPKNACHPKEYRKKMNGNCFIYEFWMYRTTSIPEHIQFNFILLVYIYCVRTYIAHSGIDVMKHEFFLFILIRVPFRRAFA